MLRRNLKTSPPISTILERGQSFGTFGTLSVKQGKPVITEPPPPIINKSVHPVNNNTILQPMYRLLTIYSWGQMGIDRLPKDISHNIWAAVGVLTFPHTAEEKKLFVKSALDV